MALTEVYVSSVYLQTSGSNKECLLCIELTGILSLITHARLSLGVVATCKNNTVVKSRFCDYRS